MVFVGGPRQCGKTTLAENIIKDFPYKTNRNGIYFDWDFDSDRKKILNHLWGEENELIVFDELHKYKRWKNWIKGVFDKTKHDHRYLVTGSARLDVYRRGGDSLLGRYHYWRLHPFTLSELPKGITLKDGLDRLMTLGGFPEPFLDGSETEARRWRKERFDKVLKDDVRDLEGLHDIQTLSLFVDLLRHRVGSPIVLNSIANELQISPVTAKNWLAILERMYLVFVVRPITRDIPRAVLKPPKVFFYDNSDVIGDEGARFENLVATSLLKELQFREDSEGYEYELRYIRDKDGREVDFALVRDQKLFGLVEAKCSDTHISTSLKYYAEKLSPLFALQTVLHLRNSFSSGKLSVKSPIECFQSFKWLDF